MEKIILDQTHTLLYLTIHYLFVDIHISNLINQIFDHDLNIQS
jgi:hypothetical protein